MKIEFYVSHNSFHGATAREVVEFDDDATDKEINDALNDWVWNHIDAGWRKL